MFVDIIESVNLIMSAKGIFFHNARYLRNLYKEPYLDPMYLVKS